MKRMSLLCALLAAATCVAAQAPAPVPAGAYTLDKAHASLIFRVNHIGFSNYTRRFKRFDAKLQFDPANMARSSVTVSVDATSLETDYPSPEKLDFNAAAAERAVARHCEVSTDDVPLEQGRGDCAQHTEDQRRPHAARRDSPDGSRRHLQRRLRGSPPGPDTHASAFRPMAR